MNISLAALLGPGAGLHLFLAVFSNCIHCSGPRAWAGPGSLGSENRAHFSHGTLPCIMQVVMTVMDGVEVDQTGTVNPGVTEVLIAVVIGDLIEEVTVTEASSEVVTGEVIEEDLTGTEEGTEGLTGEVIGEVTHGGEVEMTGGMIEGLVKTGEVSLTI